MSTEESGAALQGGSLPPGPRLAPTLQAAMRVWRFAQFSERYHARFGDTLSVRIGALPVGVLRTDRDASSGAPD